MVTITMKEQIFIRVVTDFLVTALSGVLFENNTQVSVKLVLTQSKRDKTRRSKNHMSLANLLHCFFVASSIVRNTTKE